MNAENGRRLSRAAWLALGVHVVAGAAMLLVLRRGLSTNPEIQDRMRFVAENAAAWRGAWATWNLAALSIVYFFLCFARFHASGEPVAGRCRAAAWMAAAAVVLDLSAEAVMMFALPVAARAGDPASFVLLDRRAVLLTGFAANALYTLATVVAAVATRGSYPAWTSSAGALIGVVGALLSLSALAASVAGMFWTNAFLVPLLSVWLLGVALNARRRST